MKQIKSFRISEENIKLLKWYSKEQDRSESWIVNHAIEKFFDWKESEVRPSIK